MDYNEKGREHFNFVSRGFSRSDLNNLVMKEQTMREKCDMVGELAKDVLLVFQLIKDYCAGIYHVSLTSILMLVAAVAYLVMPIDAVPDILPFIGYLDDIGVLTFAFNYCASEISRYREWKMSQ